MTGVTAHAEFIKNLPEPIYKGASQLWFDSKFPRHLFIELTRRCNLACHYCPRQEESPGDMDFGLFRKIVDEASEFGSRSFSLHLFGEPLLYDRLFEGIRYIKRKNRRHTVLLTTNGSLLEAKRKDIMAVGVSKLIISAKSEVKIPLKVQKELKSWGKAVVRNLENLDEIKTILPVETRKPHNYGGTVNIKGRDTKKRWPCYHLWLAPAITWNGDFLICCSDPLKIACQEGHENVKYKSISEMWQAARFRLYRKDHLRGIYHGPCTHCDVWSEYPDMFFEWQKSSS